MLYPAKLWFMRDYIRMAIAQVPPRPRRMTSTRIELLGPAASEALRTTTGSAQIPHFHALHLAQPNTKQYRSSAFLNPWLSVERITPPIANENVPEA